MVSGLFNVPRAVNTCSCVPFDVNFTMRLWSESATKSAPALSTAIDHGVLRPKSKVARVTPVVDSLVTRLVDESHAYSKPSTGLYTTPSGE